MKRSKAYQITYEVLNAVTHGLGFLLAIAAGILLIFHILRRPVTGLEVTAIAIYVATVGFFLLASTLFHSLVFTRAAKVFQFFDHAGIYLVILGSYTPYTWLLIKGWVGWTIWGAILAMTVAGFIYDLFFVGRWPWVSVAIYLVMGWLAVLVIDDMQAYLSNQALTFLLIGGIAYTVGALFYALKRVRYTHAIWHVFVLIGAGAHFLAIYLYVI